MIKLADILNRVSSMAYSAFFYSPLKSGDEESYYFSEPEEIHFIKDLEKVGGFLSRLDEINKNNSFGYTILPYELGFLFERRLRKLLTQKDERAILENSLIVTFNKRNANRIKTADIDFRGMEEQHVDVGNFKLNESKNSFTNKVEHIKNLIAEGETYQVNLTAAASFQFKGSVEKLFYNLLLKQSAEYSAFINLPNKNILSLSPELFFKLEGNKVTAKPMKGTANRGKNIQEDLRKEEELFLSEKNRAENLMIVDLLRNDLGKISKQNSVSVKKLFEIEKYESLFQMISIIKSTLKNHTKISDLIKSIFPCGSITGAPKIRTMEIIHRLEKIPRGIYTGSIGLLLPEKSIFNIAIRTVELNKTNKIGNIGLGAGITWCSNANEEYNEVLSKGAFLTQPVSEFEIFTSLIFEKGKPFLLKQHLHRLKSSAEYFLFYFDTKKVQKELTKCYDSLREKKYYKIKVSVNKFGKLTITKTELKNNSQQWMENARVIISDTKIDSRNSFQYFKTTNRELYTTELQKYKVAGFDEVLFLNEQNNLTEGTTTNIFIFHNGKWKTPPISSGILNGVYRNYFIKKHEVSEEEISISDLKHSEKIILTNAVRKEISVKEIVFKGKTIFRRK
ncbi:MAG: aminodeoxychorismate synthase component I [Ignavibacteriaceae bacterium]|jgi:para-aminobenzoate synthetase/4-amino-4-deoxychorismate lyase|nr:aminodeoxychorismate synthase component I [Ignavibacteriaceae bacterium]